jgi:hypothetical protein
MPKIDVTSIDGYDTMSAEDKLKLLENYDLPDYESEGYVKKDAYDKATSELSNLKRSIKAQLSEEDKVKTETAERMRELEERLKEYETQNFMMTNKTKLLALGFEDALATDAVKALAETNYDKLYDVFKKTLANTEKRVRSEALKNTPHPQATSTETANISKEQFDKMTYSQQMTSIAKNPELIKFI